jgi:alkylation response protein AidB-like acyl-CoA dehydrogenase
MDFELPEEQKMIQSLARDFVKDQLIPLEREILGRAADLNDARAYLPAGTERELNRMAQQTGLWGTSTPEEFGGAGLDALCNCVIEEELGQSVIHFNPGKVTPLLFECNETQRTDYLAPALSAEKHPLLAVIENETAPGLTVTTKDGDYLLNGMRLSFSRLGDDYFAILIAAVKDADGAARATCFLVDKDLPGFSVVDGRGDNGWRCQVATPVTMVFKDCLLSAESVLGQPGGALSLGKKWLPERRIMRAARTVGVAARLLEEAAIRTQSWLSFGQNVATQKSARTALADIEVNLHACRLMVYQAALKADANEAAAVDLARLRLFANQTLNTVADRITMVYGGPFYVSGLSMERLCRHETLDDAITSILDHQRNTIVNELFQTISI